MFLFRTCLQNYDKCDTSNAQINPLFQVVTLEAKSLRLPCCLVYCMSKKMLYGKILEIKVVRNKDLNLQHSHGNTNKP